MRHMLNLALARAFNSWWQVALDKREVMLRMLGVLGRLRNKELAQVGCAYYIVTRFTKPFSGCGKEVTSIWCRATWEACCRTCGTVHAGRW